MTGEARDAKRALRAEVRARRRAMTAPARAEASEGLTRRMIELVQDRRPRSVACYLPTPDEPDTRPFLDWARQHRIGVLLPVSREDGLLDWAFDLGSEASGLHGMPEPDGRRLGPFALQEVDLVLAPAAAVDRAGHRLGWGRGYYDRTIAGLRPDAPVIAVVFDDEVLDVLPHEEHDQRVDGAVTPSTILALR